MVVVSCCAAGQLMQHLAEVGLDAGPRRRLWYDIQNHGDGQWKGHCLQLKDSVTRSLG